MGERTLGVMSWSEMRPTLGEVRLWLRNRLAIIPVEFRHTECTIWAGMSGSGYLIGTRPTIISTVHVNVLRGLLQVNMECCVEVLGGSMNWLCHLRIEFHTIRC